MTTPNEELIARLRDRATFLGPELTLAILPEAADLLQSQAERIKELEGDVKYLQEDINAMCNAIHGYRWSGGAAGLIAKCFAERDELRAQLAGITANTATDRHLVDLANDTATRLLKERDTLRVQLADTELHTKQVERGLDKATAQLAAIRAQEPVAWMTPSGEGYMIRFTEPMTEVNMGWDKLYAAPAAQQPAKQAQPGRAPLSDEQVMVLGNSLSDSECSLQWDMWPVFARAIEAAHGIKQGGQHD